MTRAVEELLGLSFEHFTSCVVLPQGEFAEFLHAKPGDRQAILTRLLGLGVYERIGREANQEAAAAGNRAALLAEQLGAYADATDEAVADADGRVRALEALADRVATLLPELTATATAVDAAEAAVTGLRTEQSRLGGLVPPPGLAALDERRRAARERVDAARSRFGDAEAADDAARKLVADAPARAPLERARRDHAELAAARAARPEAAAAHGRAVDAEQRAAAAVGAAEEAAGVAAAAREAAVAAHAAARAAVEQLARERALLAGVHAPQDLYAAARRHAEAVAALDAATDRLAAADAADTAARGRAATAPARGPLEQARRDHVTLAAAQAAAPIAGGRHRAAAEARAVAAAAVAEAREALGVALAHRDEAARGDLAAALRPALVVGEPCPVCTQRVAALPEPLRGADQGAHDAAVARAQAELEAALAAEADAVAAERHAAAERDRVAGEITRLHAVLAQVPAGADSGEEADVAAALDALDALAAEVAAADAAARKARRDRDDAVAAVEAARGEIAAASGALRAARDPLVQLGAPDAADDPAAGWAALTGWAAAALAEREAALPDAEQAATATAEAATRAGRRPRPPPWRLRRGGGTRRWRRGPSSRPAAGSRPWTSG